MRVHAGCVCDCVCDCGVKSPLVSECSVKKENLTSPNEIRVEIRFKMVGAAGFEPATFWSRIRTKKSLTPRFLHPLDLQRVA